MLPWKQRKCQILPVNQNFSSIYFPLAKFQLVSCNPSLAIIWQMTYTQKLPKLCRSAKSGRHTKKPSYPAGRTFSRLRQSREKGGSAAKTLTSAKPPATQATHPFSSNLSDVVNFPLPNLFIYIPRHIPLVDPGS